MSELPSLSPEEKAELKELFLEQDRRRASNDCVFFIQNYLKTFDPRPEAYPHHLDFNLYPFQIDYVNGTVEAIRQGYDIFDEKSRDMGVSWLALAVRLWMWIFDEGYQGLVGSRKEDYVDNGTLDSLFGKFDYMIENIKDPLLLPEGFELKKHRTYMKLVNPSNGNVIKGESSNKNFSRGGRYKDVFFDEFGFWPDARNSWTAAGDATRCRHAVTTPPDEPSFARALRFSEKIKIRTWHWHLHPHKDEKWYAYEQTRRTQEEVLHELDISWEYANTGRPYPEISNVPMAQYEYNPDVPLYVSIDLGLDAVALGWYQPVKNSDWVTLVEAFEASDHIIEWFLPFFGKPIDSRFVYNDEELAFIEMVKYWQAGIFFGDPSGNQRHVESGVSPYTILQNNGIYVQVNDQENDWVSRRDAAKRLFGHLRVNDTPRTKWWMECIKNARYPKREENSQATTPIAKPVHDWTSHHRTQTEFFAVNYKGQVVDGGHVVTASPPGLTLRQGYLADATGQWQGYGLDLEKVMRQNRNNPERWKYQ